MSTEPRLSGAILTDQLVVMRNRFGAPLVDRAVESLSFEDQHEVRSLTSIGWTTAALACRLKTAVAQEAKMEPLELQRWVVQEGVRKTVNGVWKLLARLVSDDQLIKRAPLLYSKTFDRGVMTVTVPRSGQAIAQIVGWPAIPEFDIVGLLAGIEAVFASFDRPKTRGTFERTTDGVIFRIDWDSAARKSG